jgi:hypothetical protein
MSNIENQLVSFIKSALANGDQEFVSDFVCNGPIPRGQDAANRYLLAVSMSDVSADELAKFTGTSPAVAAHLKSWLDAGTHA